MFAFDGIVAFHRVEKPAKEIREFRCVYLGRRVWEWGWVGGLVGWGWRWLCVEIIADGEGRPSVCI